MTADRHRDGDEAIGIIELELMKLVRYLETLGRRSDLYGEVDRAGYVILRIVDGLGALSVNALAERLHLDASTVTRQAARLEAAGCIDRHPGRDDRRSVTVGLTPHGRCVMERVQQGRRRELADLVGAWTEDERDGFGLAMHRLNLALEEKAGAHRNEERRRNGRPGAGPDNG